MRKRGRKARNKRIILAVIIGVIVLSVFFKILFTGRVVNTEQYATITGCSPFLGDSTAPLKILFVELGNVSYYNQLIDNIINNQLKNISPFKENFGKIGFYSINFSNLDPATFDCKEAGAGTGGSGFTCNNYEIYQKIKEKCTINDIHGIIPVVLVNTPYGGSGGEVIYLGINSNNSLSTNLDLGKNVVIHEMGHEFGLADLYYGFFYSDGRPSLVYPVESSRAFLNVDGPGCKKWCQSYKPVSQYTESSTSQCLKLINKQDCVDYGRDAERSCIDCCVWSDTSFEYFNTNCVPAWGTENIGINCLGSTGCYFGAVYGNYAWRPVLNQNESIMYHQASADKFDDVSKRALSQVFDCCFSSLSEDVSCSSFRQNYSNFLSSQYGSSKRVGSCVACKLSRSDCSVDGDCCTGLTCQNGKCATPCTPKTCSQLGKQCGSASDGCGNTINCGTCSTGQTCSNGKCITTCKPSGQTCSKQGDCCAGLICGGRGVGICQKPCTPKTCLQLGKQCGSVSNGCGGTLNCGTCSTGKKCNNSKCVSCIVNGRGCVFNSGCCSGKCKWFTCRA